jgi:choline dehydrogenase
VEKAFDFVVVGAGSAGCVLADRLSADGRYTVAVIEAGGSDRRFYVQMPLGYGKTFYDRSINWNYRAEPDAGLDGQADFWPRGKLLGGSSSINAMVWIRGAPQDFDDWAAEGNPGWAYDDVLPFFKSLEHNQAGEDLWRGTGGRLHVSDVSARLHPLVQRFIAAGRQAGFEFNADFNGQSQEGVGVYQITTKHGWRMSAAKAFLRPALQRPNLTLFPRAHATRVVLEGRRATGVEITRGGRRETIRSAREVILAAGAINSPVLLQLSGIGPAEHLAAIGVPVAVDSPAVGRHLQDHLGINYTYRARVATLNQILRPWWGKLIVGSQFLFVGSGPLALSLNQGGGFVRSRPDRTEPNIQLYFQTISTMTSRAGTRQLLRPDPFPGFSLGLSSCRPKTRGSILARSGDPLDAPLIRPNAYGTAEDVADMLEGVKLLRRLAAQPALADIIDAELAPGPSVIADLDLEADFRRRSGTVYHPCGTVRMGPEIGSAAVDARLRVHGINNLRVVDASVFPRIVSGNTNAPTMMVAAKGAALVLDDSRTI